MAFKIPEQNYSGKIGETTVGTGKVAAKLGGEESYPFHTFEGKMPNPPRIAMEIWDYDPSKEWPAAAVEPFKDVIKKPDAWAKKCVKEYGADAIVLQLKSTDPNGMDRSAEEATKIAKEVSDAIEVPLIIWGTANNQKDEEVLKQIAEACQGKNISLSPVEEGNHKGIGASALGYSQTIVASTPIDVNLAKQLNILLGNLGVPLEKIVIDPTTGGLGYGLEYSYSVMERIRMAALTQEDDKLQVPMINNVGNEIWKCKEAGQTTKDAPTLGDPERRAIMMEAVAAVCYLMGGSDMVILRHPESVRMTRSFIELMVNGGSATDVKAISKQLKAEAVDLAALSPKPDLEFGKAEEVPKAKAAKPKEKPKAAPKPEKKAEPKAMEKAPAEPKKKEKEAPPAPEAVKKVVEMRPKEEDAEAKAKEEDEAKAKAEAEERAKQETEAKAKEQAEAETKEKAVRAEESKAKAEIRAKEKEELQALRYKRAQEREKHLAETRAQKAEAVPKTPATEQLDLVDRLIQSIDRIHKRV